MEKNDMMQQIQALDFMLIELGLYLDTHPYDSNAIASFRDYQQEAEKLKKEYEEKHGTFTPGTTNNTYWNWLDNPWPWESMFL